MYRGYGLQYLPARKPRGLLLILRGWTQTPAVSAPPMSPTVPWDLSLTLSSLSLVALKLIISLNTTWLPLLISFFSQRPSGRVTFTGYFRTSSYNLCHHFCFKGGINANCNIDVLGARLVHIESPDRYFIWPLFFLTSYVSHDSSIVLIPLDMSHSSAVSPPTPRLCCPLIHLPRSFIRVTTTYTIWRG